METTGKQKPDIYQHISIILSMSKTRSEVLIKGNNFPSLSDQEIRKRRIVARFSSRLYQTSNIPRNSKSEQWIESVNSRQDFCSFVDYKGKFQVNWVMTCKGICIRHKAMKPKISGGGRYIMGQKRCQVCSIFLRWPGIFCPCCGYRLRTRPRNFKFKSRLREAEKQMNQELITVQQVQNL